MPFRFGHMLGIEALSAEEILFLLDQSKPFQEIQRHPLKKLATLRGKTVALAFFEPSTRTRISFATAASRLGADQMNLQAESSSLKKGESLLDTVRTLDAMRPDCIVIRHSSSGAPDFVARNLDLPDQRPRHDSAGLTRRGLPKGYCAVEQPLLVSLVDISFREIESGITNGEQARDQKEPLQDQHSLDRRQYEPDRHLGVRSGNRYAVRVRTINFL